MTRYLDWLCQAENDLQWARHSLAGGFFAQSCFVCQQAGEKALKAYCLFKGYDTIRTHSLYQITRALQENGKLENCARILDLYYIAGRYPDAFPGGAPCEMITREQAEEAIASAGTIYAIIVERTHSEE